MKDKLFLITAVILLLVVVLAGCSNTKQSSSAEQDKTTESKDLLEIIKENGVIRIGTEGTYAPFTFHDEKGVLTGFDVDIALEVAKRLGVEVEFIETKWDGMFAGLDAKRFDAVVNEVTVNEDRLKKYDFSDPYIVSKAVLIVHEDNNEIKSFEDLNGKKSGQTLTSNLGEIATSYGAELEAVDGFNQAIDLLTSKRIDATINDSLSFLDYKKQRPDTAIKVVDQMDTSDKNAILFNKGNDTLVKAVNDAIKAMQEDGTYLEISQKWFGEDVSK